MSKQSVIDYYSRFGENEWQRLTWPEGQIEFAIIQDAFSRHIRAGTRVLDLGGGPGRWTIWLAQRGCHVTLADLSPNLLDIARQKIQEYGVGQQVEEVANVDACDLQRWPDEAFDFVLCLGPFYHLTEPDARAAAAREIYRVLKKGGLVFAAFMPIYGFLRRTLSLKDERRHLADTQFMDQLIEKGIFQNDVAGRFNSGFGIPPDQVEPFMQEHGFEKIELLSDSGFASSQAQELAELASENRQAYDRFMQFLVVSAKDASNLGSSIHMLYIGKKKGG
jgi:S-adenosylmethionine-dependent methyltransferase